MCSAVRLKIDGVQFIAKTEKNCLFTRNLLPSAIYIVYFLMKIQVFFNRVLESLNLVQRVCRVV